MLTWNEFDIVKKRIEGMKYICKITDSDNKTHKFFAKELKHIPFLLLLRGITSGECIVTLIDPTNEYEKYMKKVMGE